KSVGAKTVYCARGYARDERAQESAVADALAGAGIELRVERGDCVHEPETVANRKQAPGDGYRVFPPYYEAWKALSVAPPATESAPNGRDPKAGALPEFPPSFGLAAPGEPWSLDRLKHFVTASAGDYRTNAEYPGRGGTSRLAASLRFGCIGPRQIYHAVAERMARSWTLAEERLSMEAFLRRLALRDFYIQLYYFEPSLHEIELQEKMRGFSTDSDADMIARWTAGKTGYPLVDAAMRQLRTEGHVHQRAAIVAASFLCFDLGADWRIGRDLWMAELLEADEALCDGNWQRIAGAGTDQASYPRIYNPEKQARFFDAQAVYVRRNVPELSKLPTSAALSPWAIDRERQIELGFFTGEKYTQPIVEHDAAARAFLAKYQQYRSR
ncbi:MAG TPA: FAD-binding domain-containing protein, partial [Candidatus Eremiobacteraceae bacterium]|nr:FAD-binding domain-containing protein [Candidatus Eremiobacteraceae bacterium]